jgi:hypothetical protein
LEITKPRDATAEDILERLSDLDNYPHEAIAPYEEFSVRGKSYYFTPGGFLYRKDSGTKEAGGFFCVLSFVISKGYAPFLRRF